MCVPQLSFLMCHGQNTFIPLYIFLYLVPTCIILSLHMEIPSGSLVSSHAVMLMDWLLCFGPMCEYVCVHVCGALLLTGIPTKV